MKAFAHLSPTVPAIFVAAMGIALSVFLLPGAWVQGEPSPLMAVVGGAAGRVAADLPATVNKRASQPARKAAQLASTPSEHFAPRRQRAATNAHRVHRHARTGVVGQAPSAPEQTAAAAASATPVTMSGSLSSPTTAPGEVRGHRHGHSHGNGLKSPVGAPAPGLHGHGNGFGRSSEHHHGPPRGHAKKAPTAPLPAPTAPPKVHGGGNEHKGGKK